MSKKSKPLRIVAGVAIAVFLIYTLANAFDVPTRWTVHRAIKRIEAGREVGKAIQELKGLDNRQLVVEALKSRLDDDGTVSAKIEILKTLSVFKETRAVRRAASSNELSTRRAAVWFRSDVARNDPGTPKLLLDWLKDTDADARNRAVILITRLELRDAEPELLKILDSAPQSNEDVELVRASLRALGKFKAEGLTPKLTELFSNDDMPEAVRAEALETLSNTADVKRETVLDKALAVLANKSNSTFLRAKMTSILRRPSWGSKEVWDALEKVILDESDSDHVAQRTCLAALGNSAPMDRVRNILLDRRIYRHPYFGVRIDVATGLAALGVREQVAIEILCDLLVDDDPDDTQKMVRSEAFLSLWTLTGVCNGIREKELFTRRPTLIRNPEDAREYLWKASFLRPGVTQAQVAAVRRAVTDMAKAKEIRDIYVAPRSLQAFESAWKKQRREAEERKKELEDARRRVLEDKDEDAGPKPPPKKDDEDAGPTSCTE